MATMKSINTLRLPIQRIADFDFALSSFCLKHRFNYQVATISKAISHSGDGHLYALIGLAAWLAIPSLGTWFLLCGLLAFIIELPIYWGLKNSFKRRRPEEYSAYLPAFITPSDRYSLPSGHTAAGFVMATITSYFFPELTWFAFSWAALIGLSRILLGVHFFSDVVIGALLGHACANLALILVME
ncbi:TPA: phosphatase PAP2 family protein [Vibrio vulnificus]|nr:phosphatase PAP2 family protein [Vibrio vulnificus]